MTAFTPITCMCMYVCVCICRRLFGGADEASAEEVKMEGSSQGEASSVSGGNVSTTSIKY